jgi:hypothetical protein
MSLSKWELINLTIHSEKSGKWVPCLGSQESGVNASPSPLLHPISSFTFIYIISYTLGSQIMPFHGEVSDQKNGFCNLARWYMPVPPAIQVVDVEG